MYPSNLEESIRRVVSTRERRLQQAPARLNEAARSALLAEYHPDYKKECMRPLQVGVNRGDRAPLELADLLEGGSRVDPDRTDLSRIAHDVDVLVVGGGGAGASASLIARENGATVLLATKLRLGDANTVGAQAGTQAADRPVTLPPCTTWTPWAAATSPASASSSRSW